MKQIINRKRYDTDTAKSIAWWSNGVNDTDFRYCYEELFITKKGKYFIHGIGGPLSKYSQACDNGTSGNKIIQVLDQNQAYEWLEETDNTEAIESWFSNLIEDA